MKNYWLDKNSSMLDPYCGNGDANLDFYYPYQFVQSEVLEVKKIGTDSFFASINRVPILGTMTGCIFLDDLPIQTFLNKMDGTIELKDYKESPIKVKEMMLFAKSGNLVLFWNSSAVVNIKIIVSYEYSMEVDA